MNTPYWIKEIKEPILLAKNFIPVYSPLFLGNEKKYVNKCLDDVWVSQKGNFVARFEKEFARYCKSPFALACSSGTSAIYLALIISGIKNGDEVIIPTFTMISTALAVTYTGAKPVFCDCDLISGNIDPLKLEQLITPKTKAIIPVHIYGQPCNMKEIKRISIKYKLKVVEDAAEAIGSEYHGSKIGNISPITTFSLYANKIVTTGQGGMITVKSQRVFKELVRLNNYYFSPHRHFWHEKKGFNFKMTNLQAAIGLAQLENIKDLLLRKKQIAKWYFHNLSGLSGNFIPLINPESPSGTNHWMIAYRLKGHKKYCVKDLRTLLASKGIETRSFFIPLHLQPCYRKKEYTGQFPNSEILARSGILLPSGPGLDLADVEKICGIIRSYFFQ